MNSARISDCGLYRYELRREWSMAMEKRFCMFVMLNPSTADATQDDRTIARCVGFAKRWGYDALIVGNLYGFRTTYPTELWTASDPIGPENDERLAIMASYASEIVCAWGTNADRGRAEAVLTILRRFRPVSALRITKGGFPQHPLYVAGGTTLIPLHPTVTGDV